MLKNRMKASYLLLSTALFLNLMLTTVAHAAFFTLCTTCESNYYLDQISSYTYATLAAINNAPQFLRPVSQLAMSFLQTDNSDATSTLQSDFANYANGLINNQKQQLDVQTTLLNDFFSQNGTIDLPTPETLPFANQITYSTMLNSPYFSDQEKDVSGNNVDSALKYVENASGQAITHVYPALNWAGTKEAQRSYINYYKTISAVQTFNAYVMSELYVNAKNNFNLSNLQIKLMQDASDSDNWFKKVATEDLGIVLRQILLFNSQMYIVMINMLQIQKEMLTAQAMSNSLVIIGNQFNEQNLMAKAKGQMGPP